MSLSFRGATRFRAFSCLVRHTLAAQLLAAMDTLEAGVTRWNIYLHDWMILGPMLVNMPYMEHLDYNLVG